MQLKHSDRLDVFLDHQRHSEMTFVKTFAKMTSRKADKKKD